MFSVDKWINVWPSDLKFLILTMRAKIGFLYVQKILLVTTLKKMNRESNFVAEKCAEHFHNRLPSVYFCYRNKNFIDPMESLCKAISKWLWFGKMF